MTDLAGSPEWEQMAAAAADAIWLSDRASYWAVRQEDAALYADLALRAALSVVMQEPCPTCGGRKKYSDIKPGGTGKRLNMVFVDPCDACNGTGTTVPAWAVLRPLQDGGMLEAVNPGVVARHPEVAPLFRVVRPTPEEEK